MNIVLTMAGKYSRFKLFGSKVPKYLLPLGTGTMLSEVINNLQKSCDVADFYLIANRNDQIFFPIVSSIMAHYGIDRKKLIYIDDTSSQLESAMFAGELISVEEQNLPVVFANIDTVLRSRCDFFKKLMVLNSDEGLVDVFDANSSAYSYARISNGGLIQSVVDKNVISNDACSGLYGFGSYKYFEERASELLKREAAANFTSIYNDYINNNLKVFAEKNVKRKDTIVLGTPEEYVINIHRFQ